VHKSLEELNSNEDVILVSGQGQMAGEVYYEVSDTVIVHHLLGLQPETDESVWKLMTDQMMSASSLLASFLLATHTLAPEAFRELGVRQRIVPPHSE
jgi:hypothetical protein